MEEEEEEEEGEGKVCPRALVSRDKITTMGVFVSIIKNNNDANKIAEEENANLCNIN
jgi:hypothetical protein